MKNRLVVLGWRGDLDDVREGGTASEWLDDLPEQRRERPRVLEAERRQVALWLDAPVDGVGSARALARRCGEYVAYRRPGGGVSVNHHTLSDVRVAPDGMRVRGSPPRAARRPGTAGGATSFRRRRSLERCRDEAKAQVDALEAEDASSADDEQDRRRARRASA